MQQCAARGDAIRATASKARDDKVHDLRKALTGVWYRTRSGLTRGFDGPLDGITVLDFAGSCRALMHIAGDLGAEIIKVERPGVGDETRTWGPPFLRDRAGTETQENGYYLSANRNKRSVTINFAKPDGAALVRRLLPHCDVLIENFKVGGLGEYGLNYEQLEQEFPKLVYCSITGYGQSGPYAARQMRPHGTGWAASGVTGTVPGQGRRCRQ